MEAISNLHINIPLSSLFSVLTFPAIDINGCEFLQVFSLNPNPITIGIILRLKCEQFFSLDNTPLESKVRSASIHLDGTALQWHLNYVRSRFDIYPS